MGQRVSFVQLNCLMWKLLNSLDFAHLLLDLMSSSL